MKIALDEKHFLNSDRFCYWLTVIKETKANGKTYEQIYGGYHKTIPQVLKNYLRTSIKNSEAQSLMQLEKEIERIEKKIDTFLEEIDLG